MMNRFISVAFAASMLLLGGCESIPSWMGGSKKTIERLPGDRTAVLPLGAALKPDESLASLPVVLPPATANTDWPLQAGLNAQNSNLAGGNFDKQDRASIGDGNGFSHSLVLRPIVAAGTVFAMDAEGYISAHDAANIANKRWESKGVSEEDSHDILGGGLTYHEAKIYATSGRGVVAAFDAASGKELWKKSLGVPFRSPPKIEGGKLFAITIDSQLLALNAGSGELLWSHRGINETGGIMNAVAPIVSQSNIIVPYASGELYMLSMASGQEIWSESVGANKKTQADNVFSGIGGDPVVDGDVVFAVSSGGGISVFAAATGQRIWDRPIGSVNTPWIAGDFLYVLSSDDALVCFVKYTGAIKWATQLRRYGDEERKIYPIAWHGPVMAGGKIYVVSSDGHMEVISPQDGKILETREIPDDIYAAPVIAGGRMYLVGKGAELYVLQ